MMSIDGYLDQVRRRLGGMDPRVQRDIIQELRSHLADSTAANGGNPDAAVAALGDPATVAKRYKDLYGYSATHRARFAVLAGLIGVFTIPALFVTETTIFPLTLSIVFLIIEVAILMWISVAAGNRAGLLAGTAGCVGRLVAFGAVFVTNRATSMVTPEGLALFLAVSVLLIVIGWLPGRARQVWGKPGAEL